MADSPVQSRVHPTYLSRTRHRDVVPISARNNEPRAWQNDMSPAALFASRVENELEGERGGLLRYSARLQLLQQAMDMGIERFEANLIIASVQNRQRAAIVDKDPLPWSVPMALMVSIAVEVVGIFAVWHFVLR